MDCRETRDEIEKIEDLKKKDHRIPEGIGSHLKDCENCDEYHQASGELERQLFSKIKDMKVPAIPSAASLMPRKRSIWRNALIIAPLAAAAALLIIVGLTPYDFTGEIFEKAVSQSLGIEKTYAV
jgi:predicted anti-sigma-YlaC factor YlaD